jgi:hypothetical protein
VLVLWFGFGGPSWSSESCYMFNPEASPAEVALLRGLEGDLPKPDVRRSAERVNYLLAGDFIEFGSSGRIFGKRGIIEALQQDTPDRPPISVHDFAVRRLAPEVMLVTYRATCPDKRGSRLRSSVWKLIERRWQMVFHRATPSMGQR